VDREARRKYMREWHQRTKESRRDKLNAWARTSSKRRTQDIKQNPDSERALHYRKQRRKHQIKHYYGLTDVEYEALGTCCRICSTKEKLCVDHCHTTGKVRGLLCGPCNRGLGLFKDDPNLLLQAAKYLYISQKMEEGSV